MGDAEIEEAANVVNVSTGISAYLHGIGYSIDEFKRDLDTAVKHIEDRSRTIAGVAK